MPKRADSSDNALGFEWDNRSYMVSLKLFISVFSGKFRNSLSFIDASPRRRTKKLKIRQ